MFVGKIKILYTYNKYNRSLKPSNLPVNMEYRTVLLRPELFYNKITFKGGMFLLEKKKKKNRTFIDILKAHLAISSTAYR